MMKHILFSLVVVFFLGCTNEADTIGKSQAKFDVKVKKQLPRADVKQEVAKDLKTDSHAMNAPDSVASKMADIVPAKSKKTIAEKNPKTKIKTKAKAKKKKVIKKKVTKKKVVHKKKKPKKKKSTSKAIITFEEPEFNYGRIKPGDVVKHNFNFKNTGTTDLIISNAVASCGCTTPSFPFIPIEPGEGGYIGVIFDSTGKVGKQRPSITLTTNVGTKKVYLTGYVYDKLMGQ